MRRRWAGRRVGTAAVSFLQPSSIKLSDQYHLSSGQAIEPDNPIQRGEHRYSNVYPSVDL
jgi:hypothetical protein